jgi:hypothetical protein
MDRSLQLSKLEHVSTNRFDHSRVDQVYSRQCGAIKLAGHAQYPSAHPAVPHSVIVQAGQSSVRSITSIPSALVLVRLRLSDSAVMMTSSSPSLFSTLPFFSANVADRSRFKRLTSCLILSAASLARRRRTCSRASSGVRSAGSRFSSLTGGAGESGRWRMPSISRSPVSLSDIAAQ